MIYFDHNATTPIDERVLEAMLPFLKQFYGNPSSLYRHGRLARTAVDTAREQVAALIGAQATQIIFTSGGTEANNLAFSVIKPRSNFAISAIEHPSVSEPAEKLLNLSCQLKYIGVNGDGIISWDAINEIEDCKPDFVSIMLANNETGVIQDIASYARQLTEKGITTHTDAVQALGKIPLDFQQLGVSMMSLSSHKIYGPKGCGALVIDKKIPVKPMIVGGGQEQGLRAGTENVPVIVGFGKAAELAGAELAQRTSHLRQLQDLLEKRLSLIPGINVFAKEALRLPNTTQFGIPGLDGEMLLMKLDKNGIAVSSGSACASGGGKPSPVLAAMGVAEDLARSAVRVSLGMTNTAEEVNEFINQLETLVRQG